ncbi:MAG TPA: SAM-dependent methyltransferase [Amycolatopsis sp.]|nr:SAM-dependent methyltransferase [Amycolatopsis sp.]
MPVPDGAAGRSPAEPIPKAELEALLNESLTKPAAGRVYDYYLGGNSNWAIDREFAQEQISQWPDTPWLIRQNRKFLVRAVRYLMRQGIRQFVDIGSGLPTEGNVHEIAEEVAPGEARVVYIDHDPVVHAHSTLLLERNGEPSRHRSLLADLLDHERLWGGVLDTGVIDPEQPLALLMVAVVHLIPDTRRPQDSLAYYRSALAPGSFLALSHGTAEGLDEGDWSQLEKVLDNYDQKATNPLLTRSRQEILDMFGGWELMPPGLVWTPEWTDEPRSEEFPGDPEPARSRILAGVARKPTT